MKLHRTAHSGEFVVQVEKYSTGAAETQHGAVAWLYEGVRSVSTKTGTGGGAKA